MTFAQLLHRGLNHFFGDEAFARRERRQIEKIKERLRDEVHKVVFAEAFTAAWAEISESLRERLPDDFRERVWQRCLNRRLEARRRDATP